jgi:hypothetical protein
MPVKMRGVGNKVRVTTPGGVKSWGTELEKALKQRNLLNALDHGWKPKRKK